jgi:hypothetical protein
MDEDVRLIISELGSQRGNTGQAIIIGYHSLYNIQRNALEF